MLYAWPHIPSRNSSHMFQWVLSPTVYFTLKCYLIFFLKLLIHSMKTCTVLCMGMFTTNLINCVIVMFVMYHLSFSWNWYLLFTGGFSTPSHHGSLTRRHKTRTPMTGIATPVKHMSSTDIPNSHNQSGTIGRTGSPLRSFSVPEPPGSGKSSTPKHIGKQISRWQVFFYPF